MDTTTTLAHVGLLEELKQRICSHDFLVRNRQSEKAFIRKRCLDFVLVILFMINMLKRPLQDELDEFFKLESGNAVAVRVVTKSAFSQARKKLKYQAFVELNQVQTAYFYRHLKVGKWHDLRLVAVDGSTIQLPNTAEIMAHFGAWHPAKGGPCPMARVSQAFDVLNQVTLDALIAPKAIGERDLAAAHCACLGEGDSVLLDRGYPAFWLFMLILSQKAGFCARLKLSGWKIVERFVASGLPEQIVTLQPSYAARKECQARELSTQPIRIRLIRVELADGEIEVLATSLLDTQYYPISVFKELYHLRWPVEEDYKVIKCRIEVENFSGTSVLAIYQDFHAKLFTANLTAILARPAQKVVSQDGAGKKNPYQVNLTNAISKIKDTVVLFFIHHDIFALLENLWQLMIKTIEPIRPNRSYPRIRRVQPRKFPMCYKPTR
jgi:hypothetical protein